MLILLQNCVAMLSHFYTVSAFNQLATWSFFI